MTEETGQHARPACPWWLLSFFAPLCPPAKPPWQETNVAEETDCGGHPFNVDSLTSVEKLDWMINQSYNQHVIYMGQMESKQKWLQWRNNVAACQTQGQRLKTGELKYVRTRVMVSCIIWILHWTQTRWSVICYRIWWLFMLLCIFVCRMHILLWKYCSTKLHNLYKSPDQVPWYFVYFV